MKGVKRRAGDILKFSERLHGWADCQGRTDFFPHGALLRAGHMEGLVREKSQFAAGWFSSAWGGCLLSVDLWTASAATEMIR